MGSSQQIFDKLQTTNSRIEKENGRDWVNVNKISDTNFEILTNLGYRVKKYYNNYDESYYIISW